jgi:hypothetical protein
MNKSLLKSIFPYFIGSRILFLVFTILAAVYFPIREGYLGKQFDSSVPYLVGVWGNFDGRHFLSIATEGYQKTNFAYFPLYPFIISLIGYLIQWW